MMKYIFLFASICNLFSCSNKEDDTSIMVDPEDSITVNFSNLKPGQQTTYLRINTKCLPPELEGLFPIPFTLDTLLVTVESNEGNKYSVSENFIPHENSSTGNPYKTYYDIIDHGDFVLIPERDSSQLFWFYANDTLHLNPTNITNLEQVDCLININEELFTGNEIGKLDQFILNNTINHDVTIDNKYVVSCLPPIVAMDQNLYLIYDEDGLHASYQLTILDNGEIEAYFGFAWAEASYVKEK